MSADRERSTVLSRRAVSRETLCAMDRYADLLLAWQAKTNLIAPSTIPELWTRHLEEGLILADLIPPGAGKVADLGSGGGLPGLVLAIILKERGTGSIDLVESNGKKAAFLRLVIRELGLPASVHPVRIETAGRIIADADIVTARALAPLVRLLDFVAPYLHERASCLFPKGRTHEEEIGEATAQYRFHMVKHRDGRGDAESVILEIRDPKRVNAG